MEDKLLSAHAVAGNAAVVIENGSAYLRAGFAGQERPAHVFPSVVGRKASLGGEKGATLFGFDAINAKEELQINYPVKSAVITEWNDMTSLWKYTFRQALRVNPEERRVLLTEPIENPKMHREKMTEIMFERFKVAGLCIASSPVLALYANGRREGLVLDSGANGTCVVPVNFDCPLPHAGSMLELSAYDLTTYMIKMLAERVVCFTAPPERVKQMVYEIKEKLCYVALDYEEELKRPLEEVEATYQLPDGQPLTLGRERFMCTEILFQPSLIGRTSVKGVGHTVCEAWHKCEGDALQPTVVLSGSNTCYPGFSARLMKEISALRPDIKEWKVVASSNPSKRKYCVWYGGSHVATASGGEIWVSKAEYEEYGASWIHTKCL